MSVTTNRATSDGEPDDETPSVPAQPARGHGGSVAHACLLTAGGLITTLAGVETALVTAHATAAAFVVAIVMGVLIAGALTVAGIDVWRNGR